MIKDLFEYEGQIDANFMVKTVDKGVAGNGKPYLNVVFQDNSGTIEAKKWDVFDSDLAIMVPGDVIGVQGTVMKYKGKAQIKIGKIYQLNQLMLDKSEFVQTAPVKKNDMIDEVRHFIGMINDSDIKSVVEGVLNDHWDAYISYPAAKSIHQAYEGGLIYHSLSVCKVGYAIAQLYPELFDLDYVIAGTLMHDIGKVEEFNGPVGTYYTRIGKLESHIQIGAMMVNVKCKELKLSAEKTDLLTHIILSHHGIPEYGSPIVPKTPEAFLVHLADDTDAKCDIMRTVLKGVKPGEFSSKVVSMDGVELYKKTEE